MFNFIFRAFYFLRWIYTLIRICHGRENKNLEIKQKKTKQASEIVLLLGGNGTLSTALLCVTHTHTQNLFIRDLNQQHTHKHIKKTLLPDQLKTMRRHVRRQTANSIFLANQPTRTMNVLRCWKEARTRKTNQYIKNTHSKANNNLLLALYSTALSIW